MERQIMPQEVKEANLAESAFLMVAGKYRRRGIEFTDDEQNKLKDIIKVCIKENKIIENKEFNGFDNGKLWAEAEARFFYFEFGIDIIGYLGGLGNESAVSSRFECLKADIKAKREKRSYS